MDESKQSDVETSIWNGVVDDETAESSGTTSEQTVEQILHFLQLYWKRRVLALTIIGAGIILSVAFALSLQNYYTSTTSLMPPDNSSPYSSMLSMLSGSSAVESIGGEALGLSTPGELLTSILVSRTVRDAMVARYDLTHYYKARTIEDAGRALGRSTTINQDRKSGIITISVVDKNPEFACKLANGYAAELNRVMTENSTSAARRERIFLEERLKDVKHDLDESSIALSQFSTKNKTIDIPTQAKSMMDASLRIQSLLAEGQSQLAALKQTYSEDNYRVKVVEARNAELERQFKALGGISKVATSTNKPDGFSYPSMGDLPALGLTYYDLDRKVRVDEAVWETLTKQYEMARVQEAKEIPTIRVLDTADVPVRKSGPKRAIFVLIVTFLSFVLSCIVVFGRAIWEEMDTEALPKLLYSRIFKKKSVSPS